MVVDDPAEAARLVGAGELVVLIVAESDPPVAWPEGPGRLALFVGPASDRAVWDAATTMAEELFRTRP